MDLKEKKENTKSLLPLNFKLRPLKTDHGDTNGPSRRTRVDPNSLRLLISMMLTQHQLMNTENCSELVEAREPGCSLPQERIPTTLEDFHVRSLSFTRDHG